MRELYKEMVNIHKGWGMVPAADGEQLRVLAEEVEAIDLKEEE